VFVEFEGKVALVTGGVRGIGLNIAEALVREGASVFICGRNPATLKTALGHLRTFGAETSAAGTVADVRSYKDCRKVVQQAATQFGGIDILVNNAGIGIFKPIDHLTAEEWDTSIQTNLSSVFLLLSRSRSDYAAARWRPHLQACSPFMVSPEAPPTVLLNSA